MFRCFVNSCRALFNDMFSSIHQSLERIFCSIFPDRDNVACARQKQFAVGEKSLIARAEFFRKATSIRERKAFSCPLE